MINMSFNCPKKIEEFNKTGNHFHCSTCDKRIHDFRGESDRDIAKIINENSGSTCGIIHPSQLANGYQHHLSKAFLRAFLFYLSII